MQYHLAEERWAYNDFVVLQETIAQDITKVKEYMYKCLGEERPQEPYFTMSEVCFVCKYTMEILHCRVAADLFLSGCDRVVA